MEREEGIRVARVKFTAALPRVQGAQVRARLREVPPAPRACGTQPGWKAMVGQEAVAA